MMLLLDGGSGGGLQQGGLQGAPLDSAFLTYDPEAGGADFAEPAAALSPPAAPALHDGTPEGGAHAHRRAAAGAPQQLAQQHHADHQAHHHLHHQQAAAAAAAAYGAALQPMYAAQPQPRHAAPPPGPGYLDALWDRRRDMLKLAAMALVVLLAISSHSTLKFYLEAFLDGRPLTAAQELAARCAYPAAVALLLWNIKALGARGGTAR